MSDLLKRLKKNSTIEETNYLSKSKIFNEKDSIKTPIPAINIALSGKIDGGVTPGLTILAGPSKHFKSGLGLILAKAYLDKYPEAALLFYDSEFGSPPSYFKAAGIDLDRVLHVPIKNIEELKFDIAAQLEDIKREDKVFILIDSIGNLASKKEAEDALDQKSVADMTRAKMLKSVFRIVTPHLTMKDIPMVAISHTYATMEIYSKQVVSGGLGQVYAADNILIMGRQQEKDGKDIIGYNFVMNVEKSRYVKEKSKISLEVSYEDGISKWSGLMEMALESGAVIKPKNGWYQKVDLDTGEVHEKSWRLDNTYCAEFWEPILASKKFNEWLDNRYSVSSGALFEEDDIGKVMKDLPDDEEDVSFLDDVD